MEFYCRSLKLMEKLIFCLPHKLLQMTKRGQCKIKIEEKLNSTNGMHFALVDTRVCVC